MRRILALIAVLCMCVTLLAGCGERETSSLPAPETTSAAGESTQTQTTSPSETIADSILETSPTEDMASAEEEQIASLENATIKNPYTFPLVEEATTVTMWCDLIPPLFNYMPNGMADNLVLQELQSLTGITLEITSTAITSASDTVSLMIASGAFPEIWSGFGTYYAGSISEAIEEELLLDLAEYKAYFPSFFQIIDTYDTYGKNAYTDNANIGVLNGIWTNPKLDVGLTLRKDYLDELGLDIPTTLDGFYQALTLMNENYGATY